MTFKNIWALTDGRPGNDNQTIAVAKKLGDYTNKRIEFSNLAELPNFLLGTTKLGIKTEITEPYPDLVIATGRKLSRVARILKKQSGCKTIQLMWPEFGQKDFDLIFVPKHDRRPATANMVEIIGSPSNVDLETITEAAKAYIAPLPKDVDIVAVLVGDLTVPEAQKLAGILDKINGFLLITTSRRTKPAAIKILQNIKTDKILYQWEPEGKNPYLAFLGLATKIIVTADSISMCAESCSTGKPVYIFECKNPNKHKLFIADLYKQHKAHPLNSSILENYSYGPLNTLEFVVKTVKDKLY